MAKTVQKTLRNQDRKTSFVTNIIKTKLFNDITVHCNEMNKKTTKPPNKTIKSYHKTIKSADKKSNMLDKTIKTSDKK